MASRSASRTVIFTVLTSVAGSASAGAEIGTGAGGATAIKAAGASAVLGAADGLAAGVDPLNVSPSATITGMGELPATFSVPSGPMILASVPSSTASTSIVALSVSISAIT